MHQTKANPKPVYQHTPVTGEFHTRPSFEHKPFYTFKIVLRHICNEILDITININGLNEQASLCVTECIFNNIIHHNNSIVLEGTFPISQPGETPVRIIKSYLTPEICQMISADTTLEKLSYPLA